MTTIDMATIKEGAKRASYLGAYQLWVEGGTFEHDNDREAIANAAMGLAGEAGEVCDAVKKFLFHKDKNDMHQINKIEEELGDVMWYVANVCNVFGFCISDIIEKK